MKRLSVTPLLLCVVIGFLLGGLIPMPWDEDPLPSSSTAGNILVSPPAADSGTGTASNTASPAETLDPQENFPLLSAACSVNRALKERDYALLASFVHPQKGVTFTPYSTVNFETDLNFFRDQIKSLATDSTVYTWGFVDGRGNLIELTFSQYLEQYTYNTDYTRAPQIGIDRICMSGNALENLTEAYPGCRFVDFTFPYLDAAAQGLDWCSLKLVFEPGTTGWLLVGIIHSQWTV